MGCAVALVVGRGNLMDGRKYWWLPASLAFGPAMMLFAPKLVGDETLVGMALMVAGVTMQTCVNMYLFRRLQERDPKPVDAEANP